MTYKHFNSTLYSLDIFLIFGFLWKQEIYVKNYFFSFY